jgi:hypothetical protein
MAPGSVPDKEHPMTDPHPFGADARLTYGYRLRGQGGQWLVRETSANGTLDLPWYGQWLDEHQHLDPKDRTFETAADRRLLATVGFTVDEQGENLDNEARFDEWLAAADKLGVRLTGAGFGSTDLLLSARQFETAASGLGIISPAELTVAPYVDRKLRAALTVLGLTPLQEQPAWILTAHHG